MDKKQQLSNLIGLAKRAGKVISGEELVIKAIQNGKARLVILASDAASVAGAASSVAAASLLLVSAELLFPLFPLFVLVFAALLPPHPAIMVTSIAVHNNVLTIFFFIENPPP